MSKPGLAALIGSTSTQDFLSETWPNEPFVVHNLTTVTALTELPFLRSLEALLNSWPYSIQAHLPDVSDESHAIDASATDAKKLFQNRMSLLFNQANRISPVLQGWLDQLKVDLGLPRSTYARCMIYATPDGKGTAPHFDQNVNFVLQVRGTKKWSLAPNANVENPTQRYTLGQAMDPELRSYWNGDAPSVLPTEQKSDIVLQPGSLLFVPRGYWHSTEATGEALALNFTFSQPTWVDLVTAALRSRLNQAPEWRGLADGVNSPNGVVRENAELQLEALLQDLVLDLPHWNAKDILNSTEGANRAEDES